ncbi:MAG TPA: hypothetical protein VFM32_10805, partial [Spongiibacteraceae bacterium]|nr:hypothetical protein [Spongiibacteraceae bacterium]
ILTMLPMFVWANGGRAFTLPSGVKVEIIEVPFNAKLFKISGCKNTDSACLINGKIPWGVAFGLPATYIKSLVISYNNQSYELDVSNMYNAWGARPLEVSGGPRYFGGKCFDTKNCQFRGLFSDAAGSFVAEWRIVNGIPMRTVLTDSNDVVNLFTQNIDPPEFE